jgi:isocitrate/isopropylmalate dehydrogenase
MPFLIRKLADGLFLDVCKQVSKDFPNIKFNDVLLDRACLHVCLRIDLYKFDQLIANNCIFIDHCWSFCLLWYRHGYA